MHLLSTIFNHVLIHICEYLKHYIICIIAFIQMILELDIIQSWECITFKQITKSMFSATEKKKKKTL